MKSRFILVALAIITSVGCNNHKQALEDHSPAGKIFRQSCAACHGIDGEGLVIGGKAVPNLKKGKAQSDSDQRLKQQIEDGGKGMPPFRFELTPDQIDDVVRFIRTFQTADNSPKS
ncbi:MAG TPA: c-type cytochrome [Pyrinomonadaceae bacterium]